MVVAITIAMREPASDVAPVAAKVVSTLSVPPPPPAAANLEVPMHMGAAAAAATLEVPVEAAAAAAPELRP